MTKHLKLLEEAGIVQRAVEGRTYRLRLHAPALDPATDWLELHSSLGSALSGSS